LVRGWIGQRRGPPPRRLVGSARVRAAAGTCAAAAGEPQRARAQAVLGADVMVGASAAHGAYVVVGESGLGGAWAPVRGTDGGVVARAVPLSFSIDHGIEMSQMHFGPYIVWQNEPRHDLRL